MTWILQDAEGKFLKEVNCQYDACDIASMMFEAKRVEINFEEKVATIIEVY